MGRTVVTIGREFGSGGREIARRLAELLEVPFYDRQIIALAARDTGFSEEFIQETEQKKTNSFLYNLYYSGQNLPVNDQVFIAQSKVIRQVAEKGGCVIVGRCSDYVLRDRPGCLHVFIHAPLEERIRRAEQEHGGGEESPKTLVARQDKERAAYYAHFTARKWGDLSNYHLTVDSSLGPERVADLLAGLVKSMESAG